MRQDILRGYIKPLKARLFDANDVEDAFRFMASGKHKGKILLKVAGENDDSEVYLKKVLPRVYCGETESTILVGGLGGFGLELADWLILRGCKKLVMSSSRGITNGYQAARIK